MPRRAFLIVGDYPCILVVNFMTWKWRSDFAVKTASYQFEKGSRCFDDKRTTGSSLEPRCRRKATTAAFSTASAVVGEKRRGRRPAKRERLRASAVAADDSGATAARSTSLTAKRTPITASATSLMWESAFLPGPCFCFMFAESGGGGEGVGGGGWGVGGGRRHFAGFTKRRRSHQSPIIAMRN